MELLSRFRKKEEPQQDSLELGLLKWNELKTQHDSLKKLNYKLTGKTTIIMPDGKQITYPAGVELIVIPAHTSEPAGHLGKPLHYPKQINIFVPEVARSQAGLLEEQHTLLYHAEPEAQQIYDYTDDSLLPSGKTITDTDSDAFAYVSGLISHFARGETIASK